MFNTSQDQMHSEDFQQCNGWKILTQILQEHLDTNQISYEKDSWSKYLPDIVDILSISGILMTGSVVHSIILDVATHEKS